MKLEHFSFLILLLFINFFIHVKSFQSSIRSISNIYTNLQHIQRYDRERMLSADAGMNDLSPGDMTIAELVAFAEYEKQEKERLMKEKLKSKMPSKKKVEDKEYEAYWKKKEREPKEGSKAAKIKEKNILKAYYALKETPDWKDTFPSIEQIQSDQAQNSFSGPRRIPTPVVYGASKPIFHI